MNALSQLSHACIGWFMDRQETGWVRDVMKKSGQDVLWLDAHIDLFHGSSVLDSNYTLNSPALIMLNRVRVCLHRYISTVQHVFGSDKFSAQVINLDGCHFR